MTEPLPSVQLVKVIDATPRELFEAWLSPEALGRFMCPGEGMSVSKVEVDPRVGGKFLIVMHIAGKDLPHHGEYLELSRYERLAFTWLSHVAGDGSRVTLRFEDAPGGRTRLTLEHFGLSDAKIAAQHEHGWSRILAELARTAAPGTH